MRPAGHTSLRKADAMSIVITGASGQLGRLSAELVLDRMPASEVILTTRRPEALSDLAERGARVRLADFDRPETLAEAFAGGEILLLISADDLAVARPSTAPPSKRPGRQACVTLPTRPTSTRLSIFSFRRSLAPKQGTRRLASLHRSSVQRARCVHHKRGNGGKMGSEREGRPLRMAGWLGRSD